ncbi:MAG TPA: hypothetical protein VJ739_12530, partial [Gemmataceae bacterium]|nr:hypothetical protein [Gemmataceae bacterium]
VVVREMTADAPRLTEPGNVTVRTEESELAIEPGRRAKLTVSIGRAKGFTDRVSLELNGMPPGVGVVGVAASGIVIPEGETSRTLVFEADPQTRAPMAHPFVVRVVHESLEGKAVVATAAVLRVVPKAR